MRLITSYYIDKDQERQKELEACLQKNIEIGVFEEIILLTDSYESKISNVTTKYIHERPSFDAFFAFVGEGWNVVANSDIYFDTTILEAQSRPKYEFMALCRWDVLPNGEVKFLNRPDAQDSWIFHGPCRIKDAGFYQGVPGCDNSIAYKAEKMGYKVTNPSLTIKSYHLHNSGVRNYQVNVKVPQPYKTLYPTK